jgi:tripartite-type tricarboxylate transporter receptor subunit TctC
MKSVKQQAVLSACAVAAIVVGGVAQAQPAQGYPNRFVKFVVTYPAGGSSDAMARIIGARLSEIWGQQVIVESKPGAAGAIGMEYAAKQPADGYTFLLGNFGPVVANPLLTKVNYNAQRDFVPVSQITRAANILVVPISMPAKSTKQLIAIARAHPGQLGFATSGPGSMSHLAGEMFKRLANVDITAVAYKGACNRSRT